MHACLKKLIVFCCSTFSKFLKLNKYINLIRHHHFNGQEKKLKKNGNHVLGSPVFIAIFEINVKSMKKKGHFKTFPNKNG